MRRCDFIIMFGTTESRITRSLAMIPTITAFERSPDRGKGQARDMRVRWALEEVDQPYHVSPCFIQRDEGARALCASSFRADSNL